MPKYRIYYDFQNCEGTFDCVTAAPDFFLALPGGKKADLVGGEPEADRAELLHLDIEEPDLEAAMSAAQLCPPQVIKVVDMETGEVLAGPEQLPIETEEVQH